MFLHAGDTISGQEGKATAIIDGSVQDMFYIKNLEATFEKIKTEVRTLGKRGTQHKGTGWSGTGSMTIYYVTSIFRHMALKYAKTGKDTYFDITIVNHDPTSSVGQQMMVLYNCNIDSTVLAKLDTEADVLDDDIDFTFDGFDILDSFGNPRV
ncbi:MAG: phage tail tube protein [Tissierellaceae bacterium]|nr:phage tail tube protein [Tissierellaceae bacterium]